jgi:molybdopterin molybdotransferase
MRRSLAPTFYTARVKTVTEAQRAVQGRVARVGAELVPLAEARGRVLAIDLIAPRALPGFDNSAMDGYAVRAAETPGTLLVAGVVGAGEPWHGSVPPGAAVRIFTGASLPTELDAIVIQEDARRDGDHVVVPPAHPGDHVRRAGEDIARGARVIAAGTRLTAWHLGVIAALGIARVEVSLAPRVALLATGDELVDVTTSPGPGQLVDSSVHALAALVAEAGGVVMSFGIARDDRAVLAARLGDALAAEPDVVITTGGVSVGDRDHVRAALADVGVAIELYKVAMKPGKPLTFGTHDRSGRAPPVAVFGLPGNPVSTLIGFELFVRPALLAIQGARVIERPRAHVRLAGGYAKPAGRAHYLRATMVREGEQLIAHPHPKQGSAMLSSLLDANALVEIPAATTTIAPGEPVTAILLEAV